MQLSLRYFSTIPSELTTLQKVSKVLVHEGVLSLRTVTLEGTRENSPKCQVSEGLRIPEGKVSDTG